MATLPPTIKTWLNARGITDAVLTANDIHWTGSHIVIPVYNERGDFVFSKYRCDPFSHDDQPKYTYSTGATAKLYNAHKIKDALFVVLCEGELDALRLESEMIPACSSTGGAGTFKDAWIPLLQDKNLFVCYDNDDAGIRGAIKVLTKLPAKLICIPRTGGVKDITEYIQYHTGTNGTAFSLLLQSAQSFPYLAEPMPTFTYIKDVEAQKKILHYHLEHLRVQERNAKKAGEPHRHFDVIRETVIVKLDDLDHAIRKLRCTKASPLSPLYGISEADVANAKAVPLETLIKVNSMGFATCPFHEDNHPSLKVYKNQNRWHCFSCSAGGDTIDFVQRRDDCSFTEAVRHLHD